MKNLTVLIVCVLISSACFAQIKIDKTPLKEYEGDYIGFTITAFMGKNLVAAQTGEKKAKQVYDAEGKKLSVPHFIALFNLVSKEGFEYDQSVKQGNATIYLFKRKD